jgi:hypothetical protein
LADQLAAQLPEPGARRIVVGLAVGGRLLASIEIAAADRFKLGLDDQPYRGLDPVLERVDGAAPGAR